MAIKIVYAAFLLYVFLLLRAPVHTQRVDTAEDVTTKNTSTKVCYKDGKPKMCLPKFESMAYKITPNVTSTCGLYGREKYCVQTSVQSSSDRGQYCDYCDQAEPGKSHNAEKMTDFNKEKARDSFWQSETLASTKSKSSNFNVNITIDLGIQSQITYIWLRFQSPRPYSMAIYRRKAYGSDWEAWGFFSRNCRRQYGLPPDQPLVRANRTRPVCLSDFSDMVPLSDGNVRHVTLDRRLALATGNWFWSDAELQEWTLATEIRVSLDKLNTHGDTYSKDVLNRYFYAVTDLSVGGRCHCNGHASVCKKDESSPTTRRTCVCQHNTIGDQCERCRDGFEDRPWRRATELNPWVCKQCNCSGNSELCEFSWELYRASGNVSGGRCLNCRGNTRGPHCELCLPNHRRTAPGSGQCAPCQCHPVGASSQQCDEAGNCSCRQQVAGVKCDRCQVGSFNLTTAGCQSCNCRPEGTVGNGGECDSGTGACRCKPNVAGGRCDACKPGHFGLQRDDPDGCQRCFCYGHSDACSLLSGLVRTELSGFADATASGSFGFGLQLRSSRTAATRQLSARDAVARFPDVHVDAGRVPLTPPFDEIFFVLPQRLAGNQSFSYGRSLRFTIHLDEAPVTRSGLNDLELASGEKVFSTSLNVSGLAKGANSLAVRLAHDPASSLWHQLADSNEEFRSVLANLTAIRVRATFLATNGRRVFAKLSNVTLESAQLLGNGTGAPATNVHVCSCPTGHTGSFCERCQPGYTRERPGSGPFGKCVPCNCNGHWDICHPELGTCGNAPKNESRSRDMTVCRHNTVGKNCERCADGYYGNATDATPTACRQCPCPAGSPCAWDPALSRIVCTRCPKGLAGANCGACAANFWGKAPDCRPCNCSGNADPNHLQACDRRTGQCVACVHNTGGSSCEICSNGFYGNALAPGRADCRSCGCDRLGTVTDAACDHRTGECRCKPNVTGRKCNSCQSGHFNITSGAGCQPCGCNFTGTSGRVSCHIATGQCSCQPGVAGRRCDGCQLGHFNFSGAGCRPCGCDTVGTEGPLPAQCDAGGRCPCRKFVVGPKCDRCEENRFNLSAGCQECPACYGVVQQLVVDLRRELADIESLFNESAGVDKGDVPERLRRANATATELLARLRGAAGESLDRTNSRLLLNLSRDIQTADAGIDAVLRDLALVVNFTNATYPGIVESFANTSRRVRDGQSAAGVELQRAQLLLDEYLNASSRLRDANSKLRSELGRIRTAVEDIGGRVTKLAASAGESNATARRLLNETDAASRRVDGLEAEARRLLGDVSQLEAETAEAKRLVDAAAARANGFQSRLLELRANLSYGGPNITRLRAAYASLQSLADEADAKHRGASRSFAAAGDNLRDALTAAGEAFRQKNDTQAQIDAFHAELLARQREVNETLERCRRYYDTARQLLDKLRNYQEEIKKSKTQVESALGAMAKIRDDLRSADAANNRSEALLQLQLPLANQTAARLQQAESMAAQLRNKSNSLLADSQGNLTEVMDAHNRTQQLYDSLDQLDTRLQKTMEAQEATDRQLDSLSAASSAAMSSAIELKARVEQLSRSIESLGEAGTNDAAFDSEVERLNATINSLSASSSSSSGGAKDDDEAGEDADLSSLLAAVAKYQAEQDSCRTEIRWLEQERQRLTKVADELQIYTGADCAFELPSSIT